MPSLPSLFLLALALAPVSTAVASGAETPATLSGLSKAEIHSAIACTSDPTQTFELYLPTAFSPDRRWPLLLVFDPRSRGKASAELFQEAAERYGWMIASSNNTMSDGPVEPNERAFNAMFPDLLRRLPVDRRRIYAAGFSGGAILAWVVGLQTGQLAGVISVGGRPPDGMETLPPRFALWAAAGVADFNHEPTRELDAAAERAGVAHRLEFFPGPHSWFDRAGAGRALRWMEILAMRDGRRERDPALIDAAFADELSAAESLWAAHEPLDAAHRFGEIAGTFQGLRDVADLERRAQEILESPEARAARGEIAKAKEYEARGRRRISLTLGLIRSAATLPGLPQLRDSLGLEGLLSDAQGTGPVAEAAQRVRASALAQFGFYLTQERFDAGDLATAAVALSLAVEIQPHSSEAWYNFACALARTGSKRDAIHALSRALDEGISLPSQIATDSDLSSLRGRPDFAALVERARARALVPEPR
ncbi:MAG: hypothetical protein ABI639_15035 [Thermoanaerobaculia bacterium]